MKKEGNIRALYSILFLIFILSIFVILWEEIHFKHEEEMKKIDIELRCPVDLIPIIKD